MHTCSGTSHNQVTCVTSDRSVIYYRGQCFLVMEVSSIYRGPYSGMVCTYILHVYIHYTVNGDDCIALVPDWFREHDKQRAQQEAQYKLKVIVC